MKGRALVTGATKGIGLGIARRLAKDGFDVVICARNPEQVQAVAEEIGGTGLVLDVSDVEAVHEAVTGLGTLKVLVNNAGFDDFGWFVNTTPEQWRRLWSVNVEGVLATTRAALPGMYEARYGRVITIGSEAGRIGSNGNAVYAATKAATHAFTKSIAREGARYNVTANVVASGPIDTPLTEANLRFGETGEKMIEAMKAGTLLGRLGTADEVAAVVAMLASEESSFVTGEIIGVSGGMGVGSG
ncbi:MAG TPA: SDR family NAD(P)-dependent oxidoreductase [Solirubrobacteraceae bacterium]